MASVWLAEDRKCRRAVAVKVLASELVDNAEAVQRFTMEAQTIARIHSPFVPQVFGHGVLKDGTPFMVLELLDGVDLDTYLRTNHRLPLTLAVRVVTQVAAALTETHRLGIVHRDVKPENIFLTGSGDELIAKLFDFGIAKVPEHNRRNAARLTQMNALMGTPNYMSAEQLLSAKDVDERADLWSLAVVAYLALTGRLPFEGDTFGAVCVSIHRGTFDLPSQLHSDLPGKVDAWVLKAFSRDVDARFRSAEDMSNALVAAAHDCSDVPVAVPEVIERAADVSFAGIARTRSFSRKPRGGVSTAIALCAGILVYLGAGVPRPSWVPNHVPKNVLDAWSSVITAAGLDRGRLETPRIRNVPEVSAPPSPAISALPSKPPQASAEEADAAAPPSPVASAGAHPREGVRPRLKPHPTATASAALAPVVPAPVGSAASSPEPVELPPNLGESDMIRSF
jgi:eukaryotic-like serine/threonine-protein kinase